MFVTRQLMGTIDFHSRKKILWEHCLVNKHRFETTEGQVNGDRIKCLGDLLVKKLNYTV